MVLSALFAGAVVLGLHAGVHGRTAITRRVFVVAGITAAWLGVFAILAVTSESGLAQAFGELVIILWAFALVVLVGVFGASLAVGKAVRGRRESAGTLRWSAGPSGIDAGSGVEGPAAGPSTGSRSDPGAELIELLRELAEGRDDAAGARR